MNEFTLTTSKEGAVWEIKYGGSFSAKQHEIEKPMKQISPLLLSRQYERFYFLLDFEGNVWHYEYHLQHIKQINIPCVIIKIISNRFEAIFLDFETNLWIFGGENTGKFVTKKIFDDEVNYEPKKIEGITNIIDIECSDEFAYFIDTSNDVYLARENNIEKVQISDVIKIACWKTHALFLKSSGKIYGAGNTKFGKIGHTSKISRAFAPLDIDFNAPVKIYNVSKIIDIACRNAGSVCLSRTGDVIFLGYKPAMFFSTFIFPYEHVWGNKSISSMWPCGETFYFKTKDGKLFINRYHVNEPKEPVVTELPKEFSEYIDQPHNTRAKSGRK